MELHTSRLYIRNLLAEDWPAMGRIWADFNASPYARFDRPLTEDAERVRALSAEFADTGLFFAVFLPAEEMIGYICFHREGNVYDLGYCFHRAYHGNGYAEESCRAVMAQLARERCVEAFTAGTAMENIPSCRLLEKLGFVLLETEKISFYEGETFLGGNYHREMGGIAL